MQMEMKKGGVAMIISDKIDFKIKATVRGKEKHYILIKGAIQQALVNIYAPDIGEANYVKKVFPFFLLFPFLPLFPSFLLLPAEGTSQGTRIEDSWARQWGGDCL